MTPPVETVTMGENSGIPVCQCRRRSFSQRPGVLLADRFDNAVGRPGFDRVGQVRQREDEEGHQDHGDREKEGQAQPVGAGVVNIPVLARAAGDPAERQRR